MRVPVNPTTNYPTGEQSVYEQPVDYTAGQRQLASVVEKYAQYAEEEQKKSELFNVQQKLVDETNNLETDFAKKTQAQPLGAPNFVQQVNGEYNTRHAQMIQQLKDQGFSKDAVNEFATRLGALRSQYVARAIDFQEKSRFAKGVQDTGNLADSLSLYASNNPFAVNTALDELHAGLANSNLSPLEIAQIQKPLEDRINKAAQESFAVKHPDIVLGLFGLPGEKADTTSPTNLPAGQQFGMPEYLQKLLPAEGTGKNPKSTAKGFGQFLDSTWLQTYKQVYGNTDESDAAILAKKTDRAVATKLTTQLTNDNIQQLVAHDKPVNDTTVYLAHFLGINDALKVLNAHADATVQGLIHNASIVANPGVFKKVKTVGDLYSWAQGKMGTTNIASAPPQLNPIPANWKGNVEDAIQELGMTAQQAETFISTGKDTRVAGQANTAGVGPVEASVTATPNSIPGFVVNPDGTTGIAALDNATGEDRMQMLTIARTIMNEREKDAKETQKDAHDKWLNDFYNGIVDGKNGQAEINQAYTAGQFNTYEERARAQNIFDEKNKKDDNLALYETILNSGQKANPFDDKEQKAVDAGYENAVAWAQKNNPEGVTPLQIGLRAWQRFGVLPTPVAAMIHGGLISSNPTEVAAAASVASNMLNENPNAFAGVTGGEEIGQAAALYMHDTDVLGMPAQDAANDVALKNSPEYKAKNKADDSQRQQFITAIAGDKTHSPINISKVISNTGIVSRLFGNAPVPLSPEQEAEARQTYLELALNQYDKFHDAGAAQSYAARQIQRMYGVENGRFIKYPTSHTYPQVMGSTQYVYDQAKEEVDKVAKQSVPVNDIWLVPTATGSTAEAFRDGTPAPYEVHYLTRNDGQTVYHVIPGKVFVADVAKARADAAKNAAAIERKHRENILFPGIGPVGG